MQEVDFSADVQRRMLSVILALLPGLVLLGFHLGPLFGVQLLLGLLTATLVERTFSLRGAAAPRAFDFSALVTALLVVPGIPPIAPWWVVVTGTLLALLLGKHVYGGLGQNPFNPAMVGYALLLLAFPRDMTLWPSASGVEGDLALGLNAVLGAQVPALDALTGATPLTRLHEVWRGRASVEGSLAEGHLPLQAVSLGFLAGGLWLWKKNCLDPRLPAGVFLGLTLYVLGEHHAHIAKVIPDLLFNLTLGSTVLCAFFIATDPVSAAATPRGRWLFGLGVGLLIGLIRHRGGYPDGVAFAVLLMNFAAPTLDRLTQPRPFGHSTQSGKE